MYLDNDIDYTLLSATEIIRLLCARFRDYRLRLGMTQQELADKTGLGKLTISRIERGKNDDMSLHTFLLLLRAVGDIDGLRDLLPELPESPYARKSHKQPLRIKKK